MEGGVHPGEDRARIAGRRLGVGPADRVELAHHLAQPGRVVGYLRHTLRGRTAERPGGRQDGAAGALKNLDENFDPAGQATGHEVTDRVELGVQRHDEFAGRDVFARRLPQ